MATVCDTSLHEAFLCSLWLNLKLNVICLWTLNITLWINKHVLDIKSLSRTISSDWGWNIFQICFSPGPKIHPAISRKVTSDKRRTHTDLFGVLKPTHFWFSIPRHNKKQLFIFCTCNLYFCKPEEQCLSPTVVRTLFYSFFTAQMGLSTPSLTA